MLSESINDTVVTFLIFKKLTTEFKDWDAYKKGIIDENGNFLKSPVNSKERESWTSFDRFMCNLKKTIQKFTGKSKFASYMTLAYFLKDSYFTKDFREKILMEKYEFPIDIQKKLYRFLKEIKNECVMFDLDNTEFYVRLHSKKIEEALIRNELTEQVLRETTVSGDVALADTVFGPDSYVGEVPCFNIDDNSEYVSFCKGKKIHHRWNKHTRNENIRQWAKKNPNKIFFVTNNGHYTKIVRNRSK